MVTAMGYGMVLTERTDDNEENHYNDDDNDDTKHMIHDDAWWSQHLWCSVTETCEVHEQGSKYDNKGWKIIWSYHFILFPLHIWPVLHEWNISVWNLLEFVLQTI